MNILTRNRLISKHDRRGREEEGNGRIDIEIRIEYFVVEIIRKEKRERKKRNQKRKKKFNTSDK